jgi:hypothetical protein
MKQGLVMCCSFVIPFFVFGLKYFQQSYPISTYEAGWVMCCSFVIPFFTFGLRVFFNSPTQFLPMKAGIEWCAALLWFLYVLVLEYFSTVLQFLPMKAGIEWCAALCDSFLYVWSEYFSTVLQFLPMKAGIEWCAALLWFLSLFGLKSIFNSPTISTYESRDWVMCCSFVIPFFTFGLKSIFQQSYNSYLSRSWWCAALLWFLSLCLVLEYFQQSYPISTYKAGIEWCAALCVLSCVWSWYFSTVLPNFYLWSRDWVMCCSLWFLSLRLVLRVFFNSPTNFYESRDWVMCCSFVIPFLLVLRVFFNSPTQFHLKGIEWCAALCDSFLYVWS